MARRESTRNDRPLTADQARTLGDLILAALTARFAYGAGQGPAHRGRIEQADTAAMKAMWDGFYALVDPDALDELTDPARTRPVDLPGTEGK